MGFFDKLFNGEPRFELMDYVDRYDIKEYFGQTIQLLGFPKKGVEVIRYNKKYFPLSFELETINFDTLKEEISSLLNINNSKITITVKERLNEDEEGDVWTLKVGDKYEVIINERILGKYNFEHTLSLIILGFLEIYLLENKLYTSRSKSTKEILYIIGLFLGFGVILSDGYINLDNEYKYDNFRSYIGLNSLEMSYSLVQYLKLVDEPENDLKNYLPEEIKDYFDQFNDYLNKNIDLFLTENSLKTHYLLYVSYGCFRKNKFSKAISILVEIPPLISFDHELLPDIYNKIGYYSYRKGNIQESIEWFKKGLEIDKNHVFLNINISSSLIVLGQMEEGKKYLDKASMFDLGEDLKASFTVVKVGELDLVNTGLGFDHNVEFSHNLSNFLDDRNAYVFRNYALYYNAINDFEESESNFKFALENKLVNVDLLEYHYAKFLIDQGQKEKGMKYLQIAVEKKEPEAITLKAKING